MADSPKPPFHSIDEDDALRTILQSTSVETGERFFVVLVEHLVKALRVHGAWVTEYLKETNRLRSLAMYLGGKHIDHYEYSVPGTPCEPVLTEDRLIHIPERVIELYPRDPDLPEVGAVSYMGVPLHDVDGSTLGHLAVLDNQPMPDTPRSMTVFRIFADRAAAELRRLRAEANVKEREAKLRSLIENAMDGIVELNSDFEVTMLNPAAEKLFNCAEANMVGRKFELFLTAAARESLERVAGELDGRPDGQQSDWLAGAFVAKRAGGETFPAEATLSRSEHDHSAYYTLILRNVNERLKAEKRIQSLTDETQLLREEVRALGGFGGLIGESKPMRRVGSDINKVASTDATVLITGETGTGKEVVARTIHELSRRNKKPLIKINCAAIPVNLIESEFFGHEKGAFTGATQKREGRFALANHGTIFLDEIGELPFDMQSKLLRVLQEGEFDPVGSSRTQKVDVRVIAATNRQLEIEVKEGRFREDLFYRLNVFPIQVPPLRERGDDILLLAKAFIEKLAGRMGRGTESLTDACIARLRNYSWPGNVRELQNIIERALIVSSGTSLDLASALPSESVSAKPEPATQDPTHIYTASEMRHLEAQNIIRALSATNWRVSGKDGAAHLLGLNPSTLSSRMRALEIKHST
jgi:PAS domain S-box-containing protein